MRKDILILGAIVIVVIIAAVIGANYYRGTVQNERKPVTTANSTAPAGELIRPDSATLGPEDAKVTLVEFYDPECEACAAFSPIVKKILKEHDG
ncbi:MAG: thioredoxin domain-containing protein, partial [Pyrinomonadaceae bacterium]